MKKIIFTTILLSSVLLFSCDDWLKMRSDLEINVEDQFGSLEGFKEALSGIYAGMARTSLYSRNLTWGLTDIMAQQYVSHADEPYDFLPERRAAVFDFKNTGVEKAIGEVWSNAYNLIANVNLMLENLEKRKDEIHPLGYDLVKGEALAIRAMLHFDLLRLFGYGDWQSRSDLDSRLTIPYVREFTPDLTPQRNYSETFKILCEDIDRAVELLKSSPLYAELTPEYIEQLIQIGEDDQNIAMPSGFIMMQPNRFDYYGARALQARIYMWEGSDRSKTAALEAARECIDFFHTGKIEMEGEVMVFRMPGWREDWYLGGTHDENDYMGSSEGFLTLYIKDFTSKLGEFFSIAEYGAIQEEQSLYLSEDMAEEIYETNLYGHSDLRYNYLLQRQGYGDDCFTPLKVYNTFTKPNGNRMHLLKIAEMYYIEAECLVTGPEADIPQAVSLLDQVRMKRGISEWLYDVLPDMLPATVMNEIKKEYVKEFLCEGQLFYFYKRLGYEYIDYHYERMSDAKYMLPYPDDEIIFGNRVQ